MLLDKITAVKSLQTKEEVLANAKNTTTFDVLATVGAGDIDTLVPQLKKIVEQQ